MIEDTLNKAKERSGTEIKNNPNACTLKVPHEENATDRLVHISGPPECVEFAKKMVEDMLGRSRERVDIRERSRSPNRESSRSPGRTLAVSNATTQTTIKVPHELIGMLIGKGGDTIKTISRDSACRIEIAKDGGAEQEEQRTVFLCGPPDCIQRAKDMIEDTLRGSREMRSNRRSRSRSRGRRSRLRSRGRGPRTIHIPQELIGMLIGKGGETIRKISDDTGARIEINRDDREGADRKVLVSGMPAAIEKAVETI